MNQVNKFRPNDQINALFKNAREKKYPKNQIICYQGDSLSAIHLIKEGYIKAYTILDTGDNRTMFILGPGDIFPIAFSLTLDWDDFKLRYFYQSLTSVSLALVDQREFRQAIASNQQMTNLYISYMSATNQVIITQLEAMKHKTAKDKLLLLLPYLAKKIGRRTHMNTYVLQPKLSHQEIADLSGITRETTTALLKELEKERVVKQERNSWIIHLNFDKEDKLLG
jgi:CRP-like cAMP-binding protein